MTEFFEPSIRATTIGVNQFKAKYNLPFESCPLGKSFKVQLHEVKNINTLRAIASRKGKKLGKVFKVVNHVTEYEVYLMSEKE